MRFPEIALALHSHQASQRPKHIIAGLIFLGDFGINPRQAIAAVRLRNIARRHAGFMHLLVLDCSLQTERLFHVDEMLARLGFGRDLIGEILADLEIVIRYICVVEAVEMLLQAVAHERQLAVDFFDTLRGCHNPSSAWRRFGLPAVGSDRHVAHVSFALPGEDERQCVGRDVE